MRKNPFWKHSQCRAYIYVQVDRKAGRISCPYYPDGISLEMERWDILCKYQSLGEGVWIDDTHLFALGEKFEERAKRFVNIDLSYIQGEEDREKTK